MKQYLDLLRFILENGETKEDRTGTGTISVFGAQIRFDLRKGFPAVTTKKLFFKGVVHELLWFLKGDTNVKYLQDNGVHIWDQWADAQGNLGNVYGKQWRAWEGFDKISPLFHGGEQTLKKVEIDQIQDVIDQIKTNPSSRRLVISAWNPNDLDNMRLPPCHYSMQFNVVGGKLSCMFNQRSCDTFLGQPFNIASYALLTHMIAQVCGLGVGELIMSTGDTHIYLNHIEQVKTQLSRTPYDLPTLWLNPEVKNIDDFKYEDIKIINYRCHPTIKAEIAV